MKKFAVSLLAVLFVFPMASCVQPVVDPVPEPEVVEEVKLYSGDIIEGDEIPRKIFAECEEELEYIVATIKKMNYYDKPFYIRVIDNEERDIVFLRKNYELESRFDPAEIGYEKDEKFEARVRLLLVEKQLGRIVVSGRGDLKAETVFYPGGVSVSFGEVINIDYDELDIYSSSYKEDNENRVKEHWYVGDFYAV